MVKKMTNIFSNRQHGAIYIEVLLAILILASLGIVISSFVFQHSKILRETKDKDVANYTASFAARQYRISNYCSTGVLAGQGTVIVSKSGISLYKLPVLPPENSTGQNYRFVASASSTPTGETALNFQLTDRNGKSLSAKTIPVSFP